MQDSSSSMYKKIFNFSLILLLILLAIWFEKNTQYYLPFSETVHVKKVIDGDTFHTASGEKIRILNLYCPELNEENGEFAKKYLEKLIEDEKVVMEVDSKDKYGRTLARVYLNDILISDLLVKEGRCRQRPKS